MSTREQHPTDELFRRSLSNTEVDPPASVWAGIRSARRRRGWFAQWFRMNGLLLLLAPAVAWLAYAAWPTNSDRTNTITSMREPIAATAFQTEQRSEVSTVQDRGSRTGQDISVEEDRIERSLNEEGTADEALFAEASLDPIDNASSIGGEYFDEISASSGTRTNAELLAVPPNELREKKTDVTVGSEVSYPDQHIAHFLPPLSIRPDRSMINDGPLSAPAFSDYVLPKGEWIFSLVVGTSDVKRKWRGSDDPLVKALNDLEVHNTSYGFGVNAGRKYRSGFGFTTGLISERSEQQFSYTDRRTEVSQEVITWLVTLDSQVFVSDVDTVESVTTTEQRYNGFDRRSVLRIPLEGYFHRSAGRLHYGIRAGASIELTQVDQQHSLFFDRQEGRIEVTDLSGSELRARYPVMLSGAIGVDLGYSIAEHWSIEASPVLTSGFAPLSRTADVWNSPSRFALQLRLNYHFTNRPRQ